MSRKMETTATKEEARSALVPRLRFCGESHAKAGGMDWSHAKTRRRKGWVEGERDRDEERQFA